jgi:PadR family transcriptional regulator, regulatory protein PadR
MGNGFLSYAATVILQAIASGYEYGFDVIDVTGLAAGTVYPALRRLEAAGHLISKWENQEIAQAEQRPPRKYYQLTKMGRAALAEALTRYRLIERPELKKGSKPKASEA